MKKLICIVTLVYAGILSIYAQQYVNVKQVCPQCQGYGVIASYYGPIYCPICGGNGAVVVTVPNPEYNNVTFQSMQNDGTYSRTSSTVTIYTESGHCKGSYLIYLSHGVKYICFNSTWICIQGKSRFSFNGNCYIIKS